MPKKWVFCGKTVHFSAEHKHALSAQDWFGHDPTGGDDAYNDGNALNDLLDIKIKMISAEFF